MLGGNGVGQSARFDPFLHEGVKVNVKPWQFLALLVLALRPLVEVDEAIVTLYLRVFWIVRVIGLQSLPLLCGYELNLGASTVVIAEHRNRRRLRVRVYAGKPLAGQLIDKLGFSHFEATDNRDAISLGNLRLLKGLRELAHLIVDERTIGEKFLMPPCSKCCLSKRIRSRTSWSSWTRSILIEFFLLMTWLGEKLV